MGSNSKMATEKLKITYKTQNKTWNNPHIKNHKQGDELTFIRPQHTNQEHMYLNS
jgi:hypothetical protein